MTDQVIAQQIHGHQIDILVDLKGYTAQGRLGIFAWRPVPVQVSYLGYPGTLGVEYVDYILGDEVVTPFEHAPYYSEKIVQLPHSYQVNDRWRAVAQHTPSRADVGLPETGFVFCCFNNNYKITPAVFDVWMRLLRQCDGSVLWLLQDNEGAAANLRKEAAQRGVDASRLVFAHRKPLPEHLARQRLADLFLDTLPCNAHTTCSDALWVGLPVLTCAGATFAGRVAASLLRAVDMPELICTDLAAYEAKALHLASHPEALRLLRSQLEQNRLAHALFDTDRFRQGLESAFRTMHARQRSGLAPEAFRVSA
jgi:predicted O-linked N-acetylglucosamine transferase (SPINDLY family)